MNLFQIVVYNGCLVAGVALIGVGAGRQWGTPVGLVVTGTCLLGLTLFMIRPKA